MNGEAARDMHSFMIAASPFMDPTAAHKDAVGDGRARSDAGTIANSFPRFLESANPMGVAHQIRVPCLILNTNDDPVCVARNLDDNAASLFANGANAKTVLLRYPHGGHCCFAAGWRAPRPFTFPRRLSSQVVVARAGGATTPTR